MIKVSSFYKFFNIPKSQLKAYKLALNSLAKPLNIRGLALIAEEGVNATFCGTEKDLEEFKKQIFKLFKQSFFYKNSYSKTWSFKRLSVKIKKEIINTGDNTWLLKANLPALPPKQWEEKLKQAPQILDIRNNYEVDLGQFEGAKHLNLNNFQELGKKLKNLKLNKSKETLIYCTGGIRCEKASLIMQAQGFKKVYQLEGGILNYLKSFPHSQFKNECFVFDRRVALNQHLQPSKKYALCPHCGQPGNLKITCKHCEKPAMICKLCDKAWAKTCSKNCAYHFKKGHKCHKKQHSVST